MRKSRKLASDPASAQSPRAATEKAERRFLGPLSGAESAAFTDALRAVAFPASGEPPGR